jgi:MioC protein
MTKTVLLVGTVTGTALGVAQCLSARLAQLGHPCRLELQGNMPEPGGLWLVCSSNTGMGDIPENLLPFYDALRHQGMYLPGQAYALVNLGDSAYASFGLAGARLVEALEDIGCQALAPMLTLDALYAENPETQALAWLSGWEDRL